MSKRNRGDGVYDAYYAPFMNNPQQNRTSLNERLYIRVLTELSCNRFKWVGMPDTIDERFLELTLFRRALAVFYWDKDYDRYLALPATGTGKINMYDNPTSFTVTGNGQTVNKTLSGNDCVPIWGNFLRVPDWDIVYLYSQRLAMIDKTIEINLRQMRHSTAIFVDENERLSYVNLMRQVEEGQPYLFGTKSMGAGFDTKVQAVQLGIDKDNVINLQLVKAKMWNECMTLLGINNANQDKRERLVTDEVEANNEQVVASRGVSLNSRIMAAEQINRLYDLSVSVTWNPMVSQQAIEMPVTGLKVF